MKSTALSMLVVAVAGGACSAAFASNWVEIGGNDNVQVVVDTQSIRRTGAKVKVWTKWTYTKPMEIAGTYPAKSYQSAKQLSVYHCEDRTTATLQMTRYVDNDTTSVADDGSAPDVASRYTEIAPDTIGEAILEFACKRTSNQKK